MVFDAWSDSSARAVLQLMVESVAEMVGFEVAVLSVVIGDDLVTVAYAGPEEHRAHVEATDPVSVIEPVLARSEPWGERLRFIEGASLDELEGHWVEVDQVPSAEPDAWRADSGLLAVLSDDGGTVVGILSVDRPSSGRRPGERERALLERYAAQAERAVLTAFEREAMIQRINHAESARRLIRTASMPAHPSLEAVLRDAHEPLVAGFDARGTWLHVFAADGPGTGMIRNHEGEELSLPEDIVELAKAFAPQLWAEQRVFLIEADEPAPGVPDSVLQHLGDRGLASMIGVPLGVGAECVGFLALSRRPYQPAWSQAEMDFSLQVGHDLGAALMTARALERERALVRELKELDDYRTQLFATLSHELRTPLTVIAGNLELLGGLELDEAVARLHGAMSRGADRMQRTVDDLMLLARMSHPRHPLVRLPIDLRAVTDDVVSMLDSTARAKGIALDTRLADASLVVPGDATEIDQLVGNLVSNAVKYTPPGGTVVLSADRVDEHVVVRVADTGLGIAEEDQARIFRAFYRTENPAALSEPGTGLGLAIVATVVERHGGRLDVASRLGEGTTFTVALPAARAG
ncbi:hypothetical protein GCM10009795_010700 [Nocardioides hankookensis]|uniref:histidine kinase n=1 Tax=Nocardioides hankookensis TaxID=443157 RepID=A0ABW1LGY8_9ACTN